MTLNDTLEALVDQHGILHVLTGLENVCHDKADHIEINWQDKSLAHDWIKVASAIYKAAAVVDKLELAGPKGGA